MGLIICKSCFDSKIASWKKPFDENAGELESIPDYNEYAQHAHIYQVTDIASKLDNGEMVEILCAVCKITHVAKDANGVIKVKYTGGNWETF
jgi:hypothetical protein